MEKKPVKKAEPEKGKEKEKEKPKEKEAEEFEGIPPQDSIRFPDPKENIQATPEILNDHLRRTDGISFFLFYKILLWFIFSFSQSFT